MKKKGRSFLAFLCAFLLISFLAQAQTLKIEGKVLSSDGEALPGAEVILTSPNLIGGDRVKITDAEGKYRFVALQVGTYTLNVKLSGFTPQMQSDLRLSIGRTLTVDFTLEIGSLEEEVTVIATAPIIDVRDSATVTTIIKTEFLQKLPNRGVEGALSMTAGVTQRSAFGAATSNSNNFLINGVKVNSPEAGESGMSPSYDSIEEINVMGIGSPAEYGGFSGAIVNTVMKSGGNDFHGMANFYLRMPKFHSTNWDDYPYLKRRYWDESYDANFNLGGPVVQDKLWFFAEGSYEYWQLHIDDFDGLTESGDGWRGGAKLTWQASRNDRFSVWAGIEPSVIYNYGAEPMMSPEANTDENHLQFYYNGDWLHTFSDTTFLEFRFGGFIKEAESTASPDGAPPHFDLATEMLTGNFWETYYRYAHRIQENVSLTHHAEDFIKGDHDFKFGAEVETSAVHVAYHYPGGKFYEDYNGNYLMFEWAGEEAYPKSTRLAAYFQDSWMISDRLVINPGLRINHWRGSVPGVSGSVFAPKMGIAPRLGLTFDLFGDNSTALKLHYGKYYHGLMVQFYMRFQPQGAFREWVWGPVLEEWEEEPPGTYGEQWILDGEDLWENEYTADPNLKMPFMNQYVIGIEREVMKDLSVGASFIYRTNHDFMDKVNITGTWEATTWTCDYPGPNLGKTYNVYRRTNEENQYYFTNPQEGESYGAAFPGMVDFTPTRNYQGLHLTLNKRWSNNWMLNVAYAWSRSWGTNDNTWGEFGENRGSMLGASTMYSDPNYQINAEGPLGIDPTHLLKISGAVDIPVVDVTLGMYYSFRTGSPYSSSMALPRDMVTFRGDSVYIYGEERGSYRYDSIHNFDLRLEKFFRIGEFRVGALVDVFNVFNSSTVTDYETQMDQWSDYQFGYIWGIRGPRTFRLGFRFEF